MGLAKILKQSKSLGKKALVTFAIANSLLLGSCEKDCPTSPTPSPEIISAPMSANLYVSPSSEIAPLEATLHGANSISTSPITKYEFSFGDGNSYTETQSNAPDGIFDGITTHTYNTGDFTASLTITNQLGESKFAEKQIEAFPNIDNIQQYNPITNAPESPFEGQEVTIVGLLSVLKGTYNGGTHYIQDTTGGISFYDTSSPNGMNYGTKLEVTGIVSTYSGEIILYDPTIIVQGYGPEPVPQEKTPEEILYNSEMVGCLVSVIGEVTEKSTNRFFIAAGDSTLQIYIDNETGINTNNVDIGDSYEIVGPCCMFGGEILLKPRMQNDLVEQQLIEKVIK